MMGLVSNPGGRPVHDRAMASGLQHGSTSQLPRLSYARGVRSRSSRLTGLMLRPETDSLLYQRKGASHPDRELSVPRKVTPSCAKTRPF